MRENKSILLWLILICILIGSVSLIYPFGRDQGIYSYCAKLLLDGQVNYKYSFDLKPPGIHFIFALGQIILGKEFIMMRILDLIVQILTSAIIYFFIHKITSNKFISLIAGSLYVFLYYRLDYWHTLQAESFINLFVALSIYLIIFKREYSWLFISGVLIAFSALLKHTWLIFVPVIIIYFFIYKFKNNNRIRESIYFFSGTAIIIIATILFYHLNGALEEFIEIITVQIPLYAVQGYNNEPFEFYRNNIIRLFFFSAYAPLIWMSVVYLIITIRNKLFNHIILITYSWFLISLGMIIIQGRFFPYHFIILFPPLAIFSALFIHTLLKEYFNKYSLIGLILLALLYISMSAKPYINSYGDLYSFISGKNDLTQLYEKIGVTSDSVFTIKKVNVLTDNVIKNSFENEKIYIWGFEPIIYYLSNRDCVSRFTYNTPLYWQNMNNDYRNEFLTQIHTYNPKLILVAKNDPMIHITGLSEDSEDMLEKFPEFKSFISQKYHLIQDTYDFKIYKLL